jgi:hypothetical protein
VLPLLIPTENQRNVVGEKRDAFVLNHQSITDKELEQFYMMGIWVGNAIRTGQPLNLTLHPIVWKRLVGQEEFTLYDLKSSDLHTYNEVMQIKHAAEQCGSDEEFSAVIDQTFMVSYGTDKNLRTVELCTGGAEKRVSRANYEEYIRLAVVAFLTKDAVQMNEFKRGVYHVLSQHAMQSCSWRYAEARACGKQTIDIDLLRQHTDWECVSLTRVNLKGPKQIAARWNFTRRGILEGVEGVQRRREADVPQVRDWTR